MHELVDLPSASSYGDTEPISHPEQIQDCNNERMGMAFKDHAHFAFACVLHDG